MTQKTRKKGVSSHISVCIHNKKQSLIKKRTLYCPASRRAPSNKKKILIYWQSPDREILDKRSKRHKPRKNEKHFLIFQKTAGFSNRGWRKSWKFFGKNEVTIKINYRLWKSRWRAIFPCIYLNFDHSDENWFFMRGGGLNQTSNNTQWSIWKVCATLTKWKRLS